MPSLMAGAYILSPLEESSRNPEENSGFIVTWLTSRQESRISGYSFRNSLEDATSPHGASKKSMTKKGQPKTNLNGDRSFFAAFKALPVDPARVRRSSSTGQGVYAEASDEVTIATTCREAVDLIVESIEEACKAVGGKATVMYEDVVG